MKRTFIIIGGVVLIIGIVGVVAYLIFANSGPHLTANSGSTIGASDTSFGITQSPSETVASSNAGIAVAPGLIKITSGPVSSGVSVFDVAPQQQVFSSTTATSSQNQGIAAANALGDIVVHYIDRQSGNVYEYAARARSLARISNKTLPGVQKASWLPDGSMAFVQFLANANGSQHLDTYALPANGNGGYFLDPDLSEAEAVGSSSLLTVTGGTDSSIGTTAHSDGSDVHTLFTTPLTSILVQAAGNSYIAVTKAASELDGYVFTISPSGNFTPVVGALKGLTALASPTGSKLLYSYTDGTAFHMSVLDLTTGAVTALPLATLSEKCVWSGDDSSIYCAVPTSFTGNIPDDWYQGTLSFTDRIWRIDLTSRLATLVLDPSATGKTDIDAVDLTLDANGQLLVFRNKKDGSLWAYSL